MSSSMQVPSPSGTGDTAPTSNTLTTDTDTNNTNTTSTTTTVAATAVTSTTNTRNPPTLAQATVAPTVVGTKDSIATTAAGSYKSLNSDPSDQLATTASGTETTKATTAQTSSVPARRVRAETFPAMKHSGSNSGSPFTTLPVPDRDATATTTHSSNPSPLSPHNTPGSTGNSMKKPSTYTPRGLQVNTNLSTAFGEGLFSPSWQLKFLSILQQEASASPGASAAQGGAGIDVVGVRREAGGFGKTAVANGGSDRGGMNAAGNGPVMREIALEPNEEEAAVSNVVQSLNMLGLVVGDPHNPQQLGVSSLQGAPPPAASGNGAVPHQRQPYDTPKSAKLLGKPPRLVIPGTSSMRESGVMSAISPGLDGGWAIRRGVAVSPATAVASGGQQQLWGQRSVHVTAGKGDPSGGFKSPGQVGAGLGGYRFERGGQGSLQLQQAQGDGISRPGFGQGQHHRHSNNDHSHHHHMTPTRSLWIGNIDPTLTTNELTTMFSPFGPIESLRVLPDKECAFVNYFNIEDAIKARNEMQGGRVGSCVVKVGFGKLGKGEGGGGGFGGSGGLGSAGPVTPGSMDRGFGRDHSAGMVTPTSGTFPSTAPTTATGANAGDPSYHQQTQQNHNSMTLPPTRALWVGNLSPTITVAQLQLLFSPFGSIESCRILPHKSCGFVNFYNETDADAARKGMHGREIAGVAVRIGFAKVPGTGSVGPGWVGRGPLSAGVSPGVKTPVTPGAHAFGPFGMPPRSPGSVRMARSMSAATTPTSTSASTHINNVNITATTTSSTTATTIATNATSNITSLSEAHHYQPGAKVNGGSATAATGGDHDDVEDGQISPLVHSGIRNYFSTASGTAHPTSTTTSKTPSAAASAQMLGYDAMNTAFHDAIPPCPTPPTSGTRRIDQARLRDMRRKLDGHSSQKDVDAIFHECIDDVVELAVDYFGNTVVQKLVERCSDDQVLRMIELLAPHLAAIGVNKHGTWVVQKVIDSAKTGTQIHHIIMALKAYAPPLLLDQFGNYVVQCCLRLGPTRNQFVFDAMHVKCWTIGQGRFGARAMRACLENEHTTMRQRKHVAIAIVQNALPLSTNANGTLLLTWLLDSSRLPGRYRVLAPKFVAHLAHLCTHKLASGTVLKVVQQGSEPEAREMLVQGIFYSAYAPYRSTGITSVAGHLGSSASTPPTTPGIVASRATHTTATTTVTPGAGTALPDTSLAVLEDILSDPMYGVPFIQKLLSSLPPSDEKTTLTERVRIVLNKLAHGVVMHRASPSILNSLPPPSAPSTATTTATIARSIMSAPPAAAPSAAAAAAAAAAVNPFFFSPYLAAAAAAQVAQQQQQQQAGATLPPPSLPSTPQQAVHTQSSGPSSAPVRAPVHPFSHTAIIPPSIPTASSSGSSTRDDIASTTSLNTATTATGTSPKTDLFLPTVSDAFLFAQHHQQQQEQNHQPQAAALSSSSPSSSSSASKAAASLYASAAPYVQPSLYSNMLAAAAASSPAVATPNGGAATVVGGASGSPSSGLPGSNLGAAVATQAGQHAAAHHQQQQQALIAAALAQQTYGGVPHLSHQLAQFAAQVQVVNAMAAAAATAGTGMAAQAPAPALPTATADAATSAAPISLPVQPAAPALHSRQQPPIATMAGTTTSLEDQLQGSMVEVALPSAVSAHAGKERHASSSEPSV